MISPPLHDKIESVLRKERTRAKVIITIIALGFVVISYPANGLQYWMLGVIPILVLVYYPWKGGNRALKILMERTSEIDRIVLEVEDGKIEFEVYLKGDKYRDYEFKLPPKEAKQIARELKAELPNIPFEFDKGRVINGLEDIVSTPTPPLHPQTPDTDIPAEA